MARSSQQPRASGTTPRRSTGSRCSQRGSRGARSKSAHYLVDIDVQIVANPEGIHAIGVNLALRQPRDFFSINAKDHVVALYLNPERIGLLAVGRLRIDGRVKPSSSRPSLAASRPRD